MVTLINITGLIVKTKAPMGKQGQDILDVCFKASYSIVNKSQGEKNWKQYTKKKAE